MDYLWDGAFANCPKLREFKGAFATEDGNGLVVNGSLKAFAINCGATEYSIPNSVSKIGEEVFAGCTTLTAITMTDSVTDIKDNAFSNCTALRSIVIPDSVVKMGDQVLSGCTALESVTLSKGLKNIDEHTLQGCVNLKTILGNFASADNCAMVVNGVMTTYALGCGAIDYSIPEGVTEIMKDVFSGCSDIVSITIPQSVVAIDKDAFTNCSNLSRFSGKYTSLDGRSIIMDGTLKVL